MEVNMKIYDRIIRYLLGVVLLTWAVAGGPLWAYLGLVPMAMASWGFCPIFYVLNADDSGITKKDRS